MVFKRFYDESLAQASYLIGCPGVGEAVIIDPNRDIDTYIDAAAAEGLQIAAVTETHIHADYLSGARELAKLTGAQLYLSAEGGPDWQYAFAKESGAILLRDGDTFQIGGVKIQALHTPGHTPEHMTFLITDTAASPQPVSAITGDFVFVGDVGRPDLLENAAGVVGTMEPGARDLYRSLDKFRSLPEHLLLWPGHGAGSACGKALGGSPVTSLGYELRTNWAMKAGSEEGFVREVLSGQPEPPKYFAMMKKLNKEGPALLGGISRLAHRSGVHEVEKLIDSGATVIDLREANDSMAGFIPGTLNLELCRSFVTWAGWFVPYDRPIALIAADENQAREATRRLSLIGLDNVVGWFDKRIVLDWATAGKHLGRIESAGVEMLDPANAVVLDIRSKTEWDSDHIEGAVHIPLGYIPDRASDLPKDRPIAVHCESGGRSPVAASLLHRMGFTNVVDVLGGICALRELGSTVGA